MKRCIICGNVDDDNSTVCSTCGNPYIDMGTQASDVDGGQTEQPEESQDAVPEEVKEPEEPQAETKQAVDEEAQAEAEESQQAEAEESRQAETEEPQQPGVEKAEEPKQAAERIPQGNAAGSAEPRRAAERIPQGNTAGSAEPSRAAEGIPQGNAAGLAEPSVAGAPRQTPGGRPPRRTRSGPQIYGQAEGMNPNPELYANQGAIRRNVPPRTTGTGRPMGQTPTGAGRPTGPMAGGSGRPIGQLAGGAGRSAGKDPHTRRVMETARRAMRSPLFFLIVILNTIRVAASIAAIFLGELNYSQIVRLLNDAELPQQAAGYVKTATSLLQKLDSGMIVQNILLHVPSILFCLGLWLIFITAITAKERMSGVGFGFAKAAVIIRMVAACIIMLMVLIVFVTVVVGAWVSGQTPVIIAAVIMLVIAIIVVMVIIMYYFSYLGTLKTCRVNGDEGESYGKPSAYLAVLLIILALPGIVGLLSGIVNVEISNIVGSIAEMGWMILFAVWIFRYRSKMSEFED